MPTDSNNEEMSNLYSQDEEGGEDEGSEVEGGEDEEEEKPQNLKRKFPTTVQKNKRRRINYKNIVARVKEVIVQHKLHWYFEDVIEIEDDE